MSFWSHLSSLLRSPHMPPFVCTVVLTRSRFVRFFLHHFFGVVFSFCSVCASPSPPHASLSLGHVSCFGSGNQNKSHNSIVQGGRCAAECGPDALGREADGVRRGDSGHEVCAAMLHRPQCLDRLPVLPLVVIIPVVVIALLPAVVGPFLVVIFPTAGTMAG